MTTTETAIAGLSPSNARAYAWLIAASARLETRGDPGLALEAKMEAFALLTSTPKITAPMRFCDCCKTHVKSELRIKLYEALGVDWVLCSKCGKRSDSEK